MLPSTFHWGPKIAKMYKKTDAWKDIKAMGNNEFQAYKNCKKHAEWKPPLGSESFEKNESFGNLPPSDASLASYLQKRKNQGKTLSPGDEKFFQACHQQCKPVTVSWPQNEAAIADFVKKPWPFGDLPEKVCSLASYCRKRKQQGFLLTPAQERFFHHLVDVQKDVKNEGPTMVLF